MRTPILLALVTIAAPALAEEPWQNVLTGNVVVKTRPVKGSAVQELWAETNLSAQVQDLESTLLDGVSFPKFMPFTKEARRVGETAADGTWLVYSRIAPPFIAQRDFVTRVKLVRSGADGGTYESTWTAVDGHVSRVNGVVRLVVNEGRWIVTPLPDGRSHIVYQFRLDPGGWIPPWVADLINRSAISDVFKAVEKEAQRRGKARAQDAGLAASSEPPRP